MTSTTIPSPGGTISTKPASTPAPAPSNRASEWAAKSVHRITLESGMEVDVRLPDLAVLIRGDVLPEKLRDVAAEVWSNGAPTLFSEPSEGEKPKIDMEIVERMLDLRRLMARLCLVDEALQEAIDSAPSEDVDMLAQIAMRERDTDARGVKLGVMPLSRFDSFREEHGCPEDCPACQATAGRFSTRRPLQV